MNRSTLALCVVLGCVVIAAGCQPAPLESAGDPSGDDDGDGSPIAEGDDPSDTNGEPGRDDGDAAVGEIPGEYTCADACEGEARCDVDDDDDDDDDDEDEDEEDDDRDDGDDCLDSCAHAASIIQPDALERVAGCMATTECSVLDVDEDDDTVSLVDHCFDAEECYGSDELGLRAELCARIGECDARFEAEECAAGELEDFDILGCLTPDAAADASSCLADARCEDLSECLPFGGDDDGDHDDDRDDDHGDPSDGDRLCDEVCGRLGECGDDYDECQEGCRGLAPVLAREALEQLESCVLGAECHEFPRDEEGRPDIGVFCFGDLQCMDPGSPQVAAVGDAICDAKARCDDADRGGDNTDDDRGDGGGCDLDRHQLAFVGCFADEAVDEIVNCVNRSQCHEVQGCLPMGDDEGDQGDHGDDPEDGTEIMRDCARLCDHTVACAGQAADEDDRQERFTTCLDECAVISEFLHDGDRREIVDCVTHSECDEAGFDEDGNPNNLAEHCLMRAGCADHGAEQVGQVADALCIATERCGGGDHGDQAGECRASDEFRVFGCFTHEGVSRITRCMERAPCEQVPDCMPFSRDDEDRPDEVDDRGEGPDAYCDRICEGIAQCGGEDVAQCMDNCRAFAGVLSEEALDGLADCVEHTRCDAAGPDGDLAGFCIGRLECAQSRDEGEELARAMCDAAIRCSPDPSQAQCPEASPELAVAGCFNEDFRHGMHQCLADAPCDQVMSCVPGAHEEERGDDGEPL